MRKRKVVSEDISDFWWEWALNTVIPVFIKWGKHDIEFRVACSGSTDDIICKIIDKCGREK